MDTSERAFEEIIEEVLTGHGYRARRSSDFSRPLSLDIGLVVEFVRGTQPREWAKLEAQYGAQTTEKFISRLHSEIASRGVLDVLRKGVKDRGASVRLAYFMPSSGLNPEHARLAGLNIFSVVRQLRYSQRNDNELDLTLFLNGVPLATAELKNQLTGQTVDDAIDQYRDTRDPREELFRRSLVHFAVDTDLVFMTTRLAGPETFFLPFNRGENQGAGNPVNQGGYRTDYLWKHIWTPQSWLNLLANFISVDEKGRLVFPRYHQLTAVRGLLTDARENGPGHNYLIQHSAGSGKSNSIAWLAHQLADLHGDKDQKVFDSVIILTDRRVLDKQLRDTVAQFQQVTGVVEAIEKDSSQLARALEDGKAIIVTTIQKFPFILEKMGHIPGRNFALIVDEAHSSQAGESSTAVKKALGAAQLEEPDETADPLDEITERIHAEIRARGPKANISYFAFTATPKPKTMELFGRQRPDGQFEPFSLYSMKQAIEEKFIMDVLRNYTTYKAFFAFHKRIETDPRYETRKAIKLLRTHADLNEHAFDQKTEIMLDHFMTHTFDKIPDEHGTGQAKAMVVTSSRLAAVLYKRAFDRYIQAHHLPIKVMVAFSGVVDAPGFGVHDVTEAGLNGVPDTQTVKEFSKQENRILIVANKFQTGFSQELLHTMYVDKVLGNVATVQTLSRLNRIHPSKTDTMVLDFRNEAEHIRRDFEPYYQTTLLSEETDQNQLYDLLNNLGNLTVYSPASLERFAQVFYSDARADKLNAVLDASVKIFRDLPFEAQIDFKSWTRDYLRLYAFLSQIITFVDADLEVLYSFLRYLLPKLPRLADETLPTDILENVDMESYRVQKIKEEHIRLEAGDPLGPSGGGGMGGLRPDEKEALSRIIEALNERFGTEFGPEHRVILRSMAESLAENPKLIESVRVNTRDNVRLIHDEMLEEQFQDIILESRGLYKKFVDNPEFNRAVRDAMFGLVYGQIQRGAVEVAQEPVSPVPEDQAGNAP